MRDPRRIYPMDISRDVPRGTKCSWPGCGRPATLSLGGVDYCSDDLLTRWTVNFVNLQMTAKLVLSREAA